MNSLHKPPKLARRILIFLLDRLCHYSYLGDVEEMFNDIVAEKGKGKAYLWYWFQVIRTLPKFVTDASYRSTLMFKNYLKIAFRNLSRNKTYSFLNIFGLAIGISCCLLILLHVQDEVSYDSFHENSESIFRVNYTSLRNGNNHSKLSAPFATALESTFPEIKNAVRFAGGGGSSEVFFKYGENTFSETGIMYADNAVFDVFNFNLIKGDATTVLADPQAIVVSESFGKKYFGDQDPVGKTLHWVNTGDFHVTGVFEDVPKNSHITFNALVSIEPIPVLENRWGTPLGWNNSIVHTYVMLDEAAEKLSLEAKINDWMQSEVNQNLNTPKTLFLEPMSEIYLYSPLTNDLGPSGDIQYIYFFSTLAFLILLVACINYMNLATARSTKRAKEVGMRKVMGAYRKRIIYQFLNESLLMSFSALVLAFVLTTLFLPIFNNLAGKSLEFDVLNNFTILFSGLGLTMFIGIAAGSYPAFFLSAFRPIAIIKGDNQTGVHDKGVFRKALVVTQFVVSIALIVATTVVNDQLGFMKSKDLGINKEQMIVIPLSNTSLGQKAELLKTEFLQNPNILSVSGSHSVPGQRWFNRFSYVREGRPQEERVQVNDLVVDTDYIDTYGITLIAGRKFLDFNNAATNNEFILNEEAVKAFGWNTPEEALGQRIVWFRGPGPIVGVVKNFHYRSLYTSVDPLVMHVQPWINNITLQINANNTESTLTFLKEKWDSYGEAKPFSYYFLDDQMNSLYPAEEKLENIFQNFSFLAIFIACMGLFGLASFTTEQKTKEIGIRKVLGASESSVMYLLSYQYVKLIVISLLFAWPLAYFAMSSWLSNFAYRISIGVEIFAVSALAALLITFITISYQSIKAAFTNPVDALRCE